MKACMYIRNSTQSLHDDGGRRLGGGKVGVIGRGGVLRFRRKIERELRTAGSEF